MEKTEVIRALISRENDMINHRMTWFLVLQGFMLTGIAFGWEKSVALCTVFAALGICSSVSVGVILRLGAITINELVRNNPPEIDERIIGRGSDQTPFIIHFFLPWNFLPTVFVLAWIAIIVIRVF